MINTKLVLIDGMSGSGKSTTAHYISRQLEKNGIKSRWIFEEENSHPLSLLNRREDESYSEFTDRIFTDFPIKWKEFTESIKKDDTIYILESFLFQEIIYTPLINNADRKEIKEHIHNLCSIISKLDPVVIHFHQEDFYGAVKGNWKRRGERWKSMIHSIDEKTEYSKIRNLAGESATLSILNEIWTISGEVFNELNFPKIQIDNSGQEWEIYRKEILNFLMIEKHDENLFNSSFKRFCGNYFGINIHIKDNRLCADMFWKNLKLVPIGENLFEVEGFPIDIEFITDNNGNIEALKLKRALCYYKEGIILKKYEPAVVDIKSLEKLCGEYFCEEREMVRTIILKDSSLYYSRGNLFESRLLPVTERKFILHESIATVSFEEENGSLNFVYEDPGREKLKFVHVK